jgi:hypothetical protein
MLKLPGEMALATALDASSKLRSSVLYSALDFEHRMFYIKSSLRARAVLQCKSANSVGNCLSTAIQHAIYLNSTEKTNVKNMQYLFVK